MKVTIDFRMRDRKSISEKCVVNVLRAHYGVYTIYNHRSEIQQSSRTSLVEILHKLRAWITLQKCNQISITRMTSFLYEIEGHLRNQYCDSVCTTKN